MAIFWMKLKSKVIGLYGQKYHFYITGKTNLAKSGGKRWLKKKSRNEKDKLCYFQSMSEGFVFEKNGICAIQTI